MNRSAIIIQARMSSARFPGKMMSNISGMPLVRYIYERCKRSSVKDVIVATSDDASDDVMYKYCKDNGIQIMRGSLDNVLKRYIQAADLVGAEYIVRVCGDTPLVDIMLIEKLLDMLASGGFGYVAPDRGSCAPAFYSEAVTLQALKKAIGLTMSKEGLEHVTKYILDNEKVFNARLIDAKLNPDFIKATRLTIDYPEDLDRVNAVINELRDRLHFSSEDVLDIVRKNSCRCDRS